MPIQGLLASIWPISTALIISLLLELTVVSRAQDRSKPTQAILLHILIFSAFYLLFFLLCRRLIFTGMLVILGQLVLVVISNAKYKALREPLVASDLILFTQAIRHPRLYFPFLGLLPAIALPLTLVLATWLMITLENAAISLDQLMNLWLPLLLAMLMIIVAAALLAFLLKPRLDPDHDVARHGMIANLVVYIVHAMRSKPAVDDLPSSLVPVDPAAHEQLPHIVVVQSESFFDLRPWFPDVRTDILSNYDQLKSSSVYSGTLQVPAWGAYTMRTEFSFLTGIANEALGLIHTRHLNPQNCSHWPPSYPGLATIPSASIPMRRNFSAVTRCFRTWGLRNSSISRRLRTARSPVPILAMRRSLKKSMS